jgi:hypothetical protein
MLNEAAVNSGKNPYFTNSEIATLGEGTNWIDQIFTDNAATQNYSLGFSGGSEASVYSGGLSYLSQEGIVGGKDKSFYDRYNFRFNSEHKLYKDVVTVGENLSLAYSNKNGIQVGGIYNNSLKGAFQTTPLLPMYDENGNFYNTKNNSEPWLSGVSNPYASMVINNQSESNNLRLLGNVYLEVEPIVNLTFRTSLGLDYYTDRNHSYSPIYELSVYDFNTISSVFQGSQQLKSLLLDNLLTYQFDINEDHQFKAMLGTSYRSSDGTNIYAGNADVVFNDLAHAWLDNTTNRDGTLIQGPGGYYFESKQLSYFGRLSYNYKEKYLLNATFRADASSNFNPENQWGYFPSVSAGWVVTNEDFLNDSETLNFFK